MERQQVRKTISWTCSQWQNNTTSQALSTVVFIFVFLYYWKNSITDIISSLYSKMQCEEGDLWFSLRRKDRTLFSFKHVQLCDYGCVWHQTVLTTTPRCCASFLKRTVAQHAGVLVSTVPSQQKGPAYKSTGWLGALLCACSLRVLSASHEDQCEHRSVVLVCQCFAFVSWQKKTIKNKVRTNTWCTVWVD